MHRVHDSAQSMRGVAIAACGLTFEDDTDVRVDLAEALDVRQIGRLVDVYLQRHDDDLIPRASSR